MESRLNSVTKLDPLRHDVDEEDDAEPGAHLHRARAAEHQERAVDDLRDDEQIDHVDRRPGGSRAVREEVEQALRAWSLLRSRGAMAERLTRPATRHRGRAGSPRRGRQREARRDRATEPLGRRDVRAAAILRDERLAARADQHRARPARELVEPPQELERVRARSSCSRARDRARCSRASRPVGDRAISRRPTTRGARRRPRRHRRRRERRRSPRIVAHRPARVHQNQEAPRRRDSARELGVGEARDVVDDARALRERERCNLGAAWCRPTPPRGARARRTRERARCRAICSSAGTARRARPRRLAADVDDVGAHHR